MTRVRMPKEPIADYVITAHAAFEMARRGIDDDLIRGVMRGPES